MTKLQLALDWTPNTNHAGFYVAKAQGLYTKAGLDVSFISPHSDQYKATPASRVESGEAMFAIAPSESVVSYNTWPEADKKRPKLKAVAALLQQDTSAVVTLKSSGIDRPSKLAGKRYASYAARYEGRIVREMIRNDGGSGEYEELVLPMLGLWNTLLQGDADATWVFMGWEGVEAARKGVDLNVFKLADYKIPYGYSPVLLAHPDTLSEQAEVVKAFLAATAEGYRFAAAHPEEAADLFVEVASAEPGLCEPLDAAMCRESMQLLSKHLLTEDGQWGVMEVKRWDAFLDWLSDSGLLTTKVQSRDVKEGVSASLDGLRAGDAGERIPREAVSSSSLFTNDLLP